MARYKIVDRSPRLLPIVLDARLMAGSFEYALDYLVDHEIDLSGMLAGFAMASRFHAPPPEELSELARMGGSGAHG